MSDTTLETQEYNFKLLMAYSGQTINKQLKCSMMNSHKEVRAECYGSPRKAPHTAPSGQETSVRDKEAWAETVGRAQDQWVFHQP